VCNNITCHKGNIGPERELATMGIIHRICHDCCNFKRHNTNNKPVTCPNFLGFVIVKLILEVFGAAGAIWGSSDGQCHCYICLAVAIGYTFA
jgi:hypothetical protein